IRHIQSFGDTVLGQDNAISQVRDTSIALDQTLATMSADKAAEQVNRLRIALEMEGDDSLSHWNNLKDMFPEYAKSVEKAAEATGVHATEMDLMLIATGKVPQKFRDAAAAAEEAGE